MPRNVAASLMATCKVYMQLHAHAHELMAFLPTHAVNRSSSVDPPDFMESFGEPRASFDNNIDLCPGITAVVRIICH